METNNHREETSPSGEDGLSENMRAIVREVFSDEVSLDSGSVDDTPRPQVRASPPRRISRKMAEKIKMGYVRPKRQVLPDTTEITAKHLLNFIPFDRKESPYIIRKGAFLNTLHRLGYKLPKSGSLQSLIDKLLEVLDYQTHYNRLIRRITSFQKMFRVFMKKISRRIQGPGIPVSRCVNSECPFTLENLSDIDVDKIMTWRDGKIYGCDGEMLIKAIRDSISYRYHSSIEKMRPDDDVPGTENPFTRQPLKAELIHRCVKFCDYHKLDKIFRTPTNIPPVPRRVITTNVWDTPLRYMRQPYGNVYTFGEDFGDDDDEDFIETPARNRRNIIRRSRPLTAPLRTTENRRSTDEDVTPPLRDGERETDSTPPPPPTLPSHHTPSSSPPTSSYPPSSPHPPSSLPPPPPSVETQVRAMTTSLEQMTDLEEVISENLRSLDFYTPIRIMSMPLEMTRNLVISIRDETVTMEHLRDFINYIRVHIIPMIRETSNILGIHTLYNHFRRVTRENQNIDSTVYSHLRRGLYIQHILSHLQRAILLDYSVEDVTLLHIQNMLPLLKSLIEFWNKFITVFGVYFIYGARLEGDREVLPIEERRSLAISLISILYHGRFLGQEFEWASMM